MRPQLLISTLEALVKINRPVVVVGPPGGGKTSIIKQIAAKLDKHYIQRHLPTIPAEDFGVPDMMTKEATFGYKLPEWFPAAGGKWDDGRGGILCMDDRNQADKDLQKIMANLIQEREVHGVKMAPGWTVFSTGNRQTDGAGANRILSHLSNRETELNLETHLDDFTAWALDNEVRSEVISFLRFKTALLHDFDPQRHKNPTPRSWAEGVSPVIDTVPKDAEFECYSGAVGEGAAAEFTGFLRIYRKLPNPDQILLNPQTAEVPKDPATLYALSGSLASRATGGNFERVCMYCERMPPEFSVLTVSMATRRDDGLANSAAFGKWAVAHQEVLF